MFQRKLSGLLLSYPHWSAACWDAFVDRKNELNVRLRCICIFNFISSLFFNLRVERFQDHSNIVPFQD